ncbi:hypothetical protein Scep_029794 [Stephania cephalantha]|uniref:Uncharacterized protein n=1 Tax=Stephania cephalantha TaxID=152367 RepID=A0AAP0HCM5_9MAGN
MARRAKGSSGDNDVEANARAVATVRRARSGNDVEARVAVARAATAVKRARGGSGSEERRGGFNDGEDMRGWQNMPGPFGPFCPVPF